MEETEQYQTQAAGLTEKDRSLQDIGERANSIREKSSQNSILSKFVLDDIYREVRSLNEDEGKKLLESLNEITKKCVSLQCSLLTLKQSLNKGDK
jgi:hypothetical protein